ncbi:MAG: hypothetical protein ACLUKN_03110 [Bacilli bacterium]
MEPKSLVMLSLLVVVVEIDGIRDNLRVLRLMGLYKMSLICVRNSKYISVNAIDAAQFQPLRRLWYGSLLGLRILGLQRNCRRISL